MIRRSTAFLLILSISYFTFEVSVADVHDGDASASEVAKLAGSAPGAPVLPDLPSDGPSHDIHVCHCAHPHGGLTAGSLVLSQGGPSVIVKVTFDAISPNAVDLDQHLRPPIA